MVILFMTVMRSPLLCKLQTFFKKELLINGVSIEFLTEHKITQVFSHFGFYVTTSRGQAAESTLTGNIYYLVSSF